MASRAYLLIKVSDTLDKDAFIEAVSELEKKFEVDFVDPVVGKYDLVVMIETSGSIDELARSIENLSWITKVEVLKFVALQDKRCLSLYDIESLLGGA
ncbi:MAG TPA: hypothetical protein DEA47_03640 [Peptococcaceae bacterium]|nr:MAG: hypothetical protein XD50_0645 [Clostridia bacterium 41_269]HBT20443.1 hypothetical protein [Peptococcaceae bacterium]